MINWLLSKDEVSFIVHSIHTCHCIYVCVFICVGSIIVTLSIPEEPEHRTHTVGTLLSNFHCAHKFTPVTYIHFKQLVASFPQWQPRFDPKSHHVGFGGQSTNSHFISCYTFINHPISDTIWSQYWQHHYITN